MSLITNVSRLLKSITYTIRVIFRQLPVILNSEELRQLFKAPTLLKHRIVLALINIEKPHIWLFNGKDPDGRYSSKDLSRIMREALKKAGIKKKSL